MFGNVSIAVFSSCDYKLTFARWGNVSILLLALEVETFDINKEVICRDGIGSRVNIGIQTDQHVLQYLNFT